MQSMLLRNARVALSTTMLALGVCITPDIAAAQVDFTSACNQYTHTPTVFFGIAINGNCTDLSDLVNSTDREGVNSLSRTLNVGGSEVTVNATWDADPFISFGVTTTNLVAGPVTYAFLFGTPVVPGMYNFASSSMGITVTGGQANLSTVATSAIYPTFLSGYGTVGAVPTNLGVDVGTTSCVGTAVTNVCNYGPATNTFAPTFYDNLEALLTYTQTDVGSTVSISGRVDLLSQTVAVPEPSTYLMVAAGLGALAFARRKRHA